MTNASLYLRDDERVLLERLVGSNSLTPEDAPSVPWIAPYIASGALTVVSGKPKEAGKSTFVTRLCKAIVNGEPFLGRPTVRQPVLYFSEEDFRTFAPSTATAGLLGRDGFFHLTRERVGASGLERIVRVALAAHERTQAGVLVVDTLAHFAGFAESQEQDAACMTAALKQLYPATSAGMAVVLVTHDRKTSGSPTSSVRGSGALVAAADFVLSIRRDSRRRDGVRTLYFDGRGVEAADRTTVVEFDGISYSRIASREADGPPASGKGQGRRTNRRWLPLPRSMDRAATVPELIRRTGRSETQVRQELKSAGAERMGAGTKSSPYRYWLSEAA